MLGKFKRRNTTKVSSELEDLPTLQEMHSKTLDTEKPWCENTWDWLDSM